ncbi:MFS transporter [Ktedonobacter racemifer]|uniref:Major facilitator superfamily MFS_1 n=1 Tax=Ktedonobacter racemifer DSM 44963 TaxID=485913 RepID=D6U3K2_KTERA|nr:MFS transporter [Ktedonobacter racemifer]EFH82992.1 major facilitator superfamily MFS_1 [Ktedonobacter racemifer DSM 44963]
MRTLQQLHPGEREMYNERRWLAVAAIGLSIFLSALDGTIVALALPAIAHQFQLSDSLASAVTLSYTIPLLILILPCGDLLNRVRTLPLFLIAVLGFGVGSSICGLAMSFPLLLVGRALQGCFGALIATQGIAVAAAVVAPHERGRAMGIIGSLAPLGGVAGPGIGGLLLAHWNWSTVFLVNLPICGLAALLGLLSLRNVSLTDHQSPSVNGFRQMGALLRFPPFRLGLLGFLCSVTIAGSLYYLFPFDLNNVQHFTPSTAGLLLLCMPLGMGMVGLLGGFLTDRYGARPFTLAGSGLLLAGLILLSLVLARPTLVVDIAWRLLLVGLGMGLFNGPNQTLLMSAGTQEMMGAASALSNLSSRIGSVFGPLIISVLWLFLSDPALQMRMGILVVTALAVLNVGFVWFVRPGTQSAPAEVAPVLVPGEHSQIDKETS